MSPLSCGHHSQSTSRCIADDTHRYRVCMSVGACMPLLENGMMMRVKKKKHTATGQFKLSTVVVQKKRTTSTRTQRNSVNCPNTSTDSTSSRLSTTTHGPHCARIQMHLHTLNIQVTTHWNCRRRERM